MKRQDFLDVLETLSSGDSIALTVRRALTCSDFETIIHGTFVEYKPPYLFFVNPRQKFSIRYSRIITLEKESNLD